MLYKRKNEPALADALFREPTKEYRGAPFWAWNCDLEEGELRRQIGVFAEMGMGGFNIHSRAGLNTPYLGADFMGLVKACHEEALQRDMLCYLYDEDRWPSGAAGGYVTREPELRMRFLTLRPLAGDVPWHGATGDEKTHIARYRVCLTEGYLREYTRIPIGETPKDGENIWDAYIVITRGSPWFNDQTYADTLNKKAIDRFIELTHEKYRDLLGFAFGETVPSIFTDEPHFFRWQTLGNSEDLTAVVMPYTDDMEDSFRRAYGESLLDALPEIFWELPNGKPSRTRYLFHDHLTERFTQAFSDNIGRWCAENNIMLTGHLMSEQSLSSQTAYVGEVMRHFRAFQLPGIDILCDNREFSTAKQAQSAARQYGRAGVLSELYGVTNWDFDFRGHKLQGDWQAALGITARVHHLAWVSMVGEGKRDYPASIGYQSPWYREYKRVEEHYARLNTALVRGKARVRVAMVHPLEGHWLLYGPQDKTLAAREASDKNFHQIIEWLLFGHIDFDFIAESLLPELERESVGAFVVGEMAYDAVLVPNCRSLRRTTVDALVKFRRRGGTVIFAGAVAEVMDGGETDEIQGFARECIKVPYEQIPVLNALEPFRDVSLTRADGSRAGHLLYQLRSDGADQWLFVCNGTKPGPDIPHRETIYIKIKGEYAPTLYNTLNGEITTHPARYPKGFTVITQEMDLHDSVLLKLTPGANTTEKAEAPPCLMPATEAPGWRDLPAPYSFTLAEPNVLLLDMACHDDGGDEAEEILRIDNHYRNKLGYPTRSETTQPWAIESNPDDFLHLTLRYTIPSEINLAQIHLALENADQTEIIWNGAPVNNTPEGYYVDRSIHTIPLPGLVVGDNHLTLRLRFSPHTPAEPAYLLGRFGVALRGKVATVTPYPETLPFGDSSQMGLPFYGGNITYHCEITGTGERMWLEASFFRCPLLSVKLNGEEKGVIAFSPYGLDLGVVPPGRHQLDITAYGNRNNTFGALHNTNTTFWCGPHAWHTTGAQWSYEYRLKPTGILKSPRLIS